MMAGRTTGIPFALRACWVAGLLVLCLASGAGAAPDAQQLVDRMVARDAEMVARRGNYTYTLVLTRHKLDSKNKPVESKTETRTMRGNEVLDYGTRKDRGVEEDLEKASKEEPFELLKMLDHYDFRLDGEEEVNGRPCWKIRYTPKPGMPFRNREEKVLNNVSGTLWVKQDDGLTNLKLYTNSLL